MTKPDKLLQGLLAGNFQNIAFNDIKKLLKAYGFVLERISGSHHIFTHEMIRDIVNIQNVKGKAKPYQIRQILQIIEKYNLRMK
jgi:predicted RNA binding protein YcfA (HicA-like mRNA interferase family)